MESGKFLLSESKILGFEVCNTAQGIRNPLEIEIRNPRFTDKESEIQYLESEIHGVESRIQNSLIDLYMGQTFTNELQTHFRSLDRSCIY